MYFQHAQLTSESTFDTCVLKNSLQIRKIIDTKPQILKFFHYHEFCKIFLFHTEHDDFYCFSLARLVLESFMFEYMKIVPNLYV